MSARAAAALVLGLWAAVAMAACGAPQRGRPRVVAAIRLRCEPRDARVIVDEVDQGACVLWENRYLGLTEGAHRLRIEREDYLPVERDLVGLRGRQTVGVRLRPVPE